MTVPNLTPDATSDAPTMRQLLERMEALGAHLMRLKPSQKQPAAAGWTTAVVVPVAEAEAYVASGGNIGVNQALSRLIVLDAEDAAATLALKFAEFELTVITAKGQQPSSPKYGGSHVWLRVPDGIDAGSLPADKLGIRLPGGGKLDALAGRRYVVAPPSRLAEAGDFQYAAALGGLLDLSTPLRDIPVAPTWLFSLEAECPEGLEPLHAILAPNPTGPNGTEAYDRAAAAGETIELSERIDEIGWDEWIGGDHRLTPTGMRDGCGCQIWHWQGSEHEKSATLHDGCGQGNGAHLWGGTMLAELGLDRDHLSRLDLAVALRGVSRAEAANAVGIELGERREFGVDLTDFDEAADEAIAAGDLETAKNLRAAAANLRVERRAHAEENGEVFTNARMLGGVDPDPIVVPDGAVDPGVGDGEPEADDGDDEPDPGGVVHIVRKNVIRSFPGATFDQVPRPRAKELHEYPHPAIPAGLVPVVGAKVNAVTVLPPISNRRGHDLVPHEWIFAATPGLSHVAAAADARGVNRWGLLAALLPRIAAKIPPTVRLVPSHGVVPEGEGPSDAGASLNVFSALVGPRGSGKTDTMSAAAVLVPGVRTIPPGTGEGVLKEFPRAGDADDDDAPAAGGDPAPAISNLVEESADSLIVESDEIDVFVGEMKRQGTKTSAWYRSMWMGGSVGNTASDRDRRSWVGAHTYRFGIILGAQPTAAAPLFLEESLGTPQRFLWVFAQLSVVRGHYPERLQIPEVDWLGAGPTLIPAKAAPTPSPVWITPSPAGKDAADEDHARAATVDPVAITAPGDRAEAIYTPHAVLQQLKISVLLAAMDGLTQPQDIHFHAAGALMAVRRVAIESIVSVIDQVAAQGQKAAGELQGIYLSNVGASREAETEKHVARCAKSIMAALVNAAKSGNGLTDAYAKKALSGKKSAAGHSDKSLYGAAAVAAVAKHPGVLRTASGLRWVGEGATAPMPPARILTFVPPAAPKEATA